MDAGHFGLPKNGKLRFHARAGFGFERDDNSHRNGSRLSTLTKETLSGNQRSHHRLVEGGDAGERRGLRIGGAIRAGSILSDRVRVAVIHRNASKHATWIEGPHHCGTVRSVTVIAVQNVSKLYHLYQHPFDRVLGSFATGKRHSAEFWALRD